MQTTASTIEASNTRGTELSLAGVSVSFDDFVAVEGIDLTVQPGEFVCLLGPSGCGKSTLISALAGFIPVSAGEAAVDGSSVRGPSSKTGMVFQSSDALFDWLSARDNVEYGPKMRGVGRRERKAISDEFLVLVGLGNCGDKFPGELSGGMRQRLQIARVLANKPRAILMDEPFGALDAQTRQVMQEELDRIWRGTGCSVIFVTHDINEAIVLADRIIVMTAGPAARIKSSYSVGMARPRDETSPEAIELHQRLRADIGEEVQKALRSQGLVTEGAM